MKYFAPITHDCYYVILNAETGLLERDFQGNILGVVEHNGTGINMNKHIFIPIEEISLPERWNMIVDEDKRELFGALNRANKDYLQELQSTIEELKENLENARRY